MRAKFGFFGHHDGVHVLDVQMFFVDKFAGVFEKQKTVRSLPLGIAVREMRADVTKPGCSEQGVTHGVSKHITVGMANRAFVERQRDAADDQGAAFGEPVQVVADATTYSTVVTHKERGSCLMNLAAFEVQIETG